jgi:hypothetical protein
VERQIRNADHNAEIGSNRDVPYGFFSPRYFCMHVSMIFNEAKEVVKS